MRSKNSTFALTAWITDRLARLWSDDIDNGVDQWAWWEVLAGAALDVLGVLFE
jgi:hypothetical protein